MSDPSLFEQLGGEAALRAIIDRFVDRMFEDVMIGFFFAQASKSRIKEKEFEFAARHLGAAVEYTGRALDEAHRRHTIMTGQFLRRLQILKDTLSEFGVAEHIRQHWIEHTLQQMDLVTKADDGRCEAPPRAPKAPA